MKRPTEADIDDWLERVLDGFPVVRSWRGLAKFILLEALVERMRGRERP